MTSLILFLPVQSTGEYRSDSSCTPLLQMRKEMGDSDTCLPIGKKVSLGLSQFT